MTSFRGSYIPGGGYAICDRCMKRVRIYDLRTEWSNARVCDRCYDPRPVHLSTPVLKPGEGAPLPGARPDVLIEADDADLDFEYRDGSSFDPNVTQIEAQRYIARMHTPPSAARRLAINTFIESLKDADVWDDLDVLYLLAAHSSQAAMLNLKGEIYNLTPSVVSPTFATDLGFTGVPASSTLLTAAGYNPATVSGLNYTLNDACAGIWTRTPATYDAATSRIDLYLGTARLGRRATTSNGHYAYRANDAASTNVILAGGSADQAGHFTYQRTASDARALYRNGVSINTSTTASSTIATGFLLFGVTANYSDAELSAAYAGRSLSDVKITALNSALSTYLTATGAI